MANNLKKYASDSTLSALVTKIKELFATKSELAKKADSSHTHTIANVTNLQSTLDAKVPTSRTINSKPLSTNITLSASDIGAAASSHNHDGRYYTETEVDTLLASKSDSTHNHDTKYDALGSSAAVQENLDTVSDALDAHTTNTGIHVTTTNKSNWNSAYTHSTSAHARVDATNVSDSTTNGNIKINGTETNVYSHPNSGVTAGTYKSVTVNAQGHITGGSNPTTLAGYGITDGETKGTASSAVSTHNTSTSAHNDIRLLITNLTTKLNNFLDVDDTTTDQLSELIALIQANATDIESITSGKVNVSDIINNLTTNVANKPLSAAQGVAIKALIDALQEELDGHIHAISDVTNLQSALDEKAASSYVKNNYITNTRIEDNLTSDASNYVLSAKQGKVLKGQIDNLSTTVSGKANSSHTHTVANITDLTATATELNYMDGVTSNVQAQLDGKAASSHNHSASNITSGTMSVDRLPSASTSAKGIVQLDSSVTSTSTATAATSKAVKLAYDLANSANTTAQDKANKTHSHAISDITNLQIDLDNKVSKKGDTMIGDLTVEKTGSPAVRASSTSASVIGELKVDSYGRVNISNKNRNNEGNRTTLMMGKYDSSDDYLLRICTYEDDSVVKQYEVYHEGNPPTAEAIGAANIATLTTAEYTALEEAEATNANTLYMLTDAEEDELITVEDIDAICGATV